MAFTAYAAAEAVGGSGFLAAFTAGLVIAAMDVELCDCFLDYGEASAEMFLLLTFVAFGGSLIWSGLAMAEWRTLAFAAVALLVRTAVLRPVLGGTGLDHKECRIIAWFGPRGLSSLLLVLLPVFAGVPGSESLFAVTCLVVLISVVVHGGGIALYLRRATRASRAAPASSAAPAPSPAPLPPTSRATDVEEAEAPERIPLDEVRRLRQDGHPHVLLDVRTERSYRDDPERAAGALRFPPDDAARLAREHGLDPGALLILYCT